MTYLFDWQFTVDSRTFHYYDDGDYCDGKQSGRARGETQDRPTAVEEL